MTRLLILRHGNTFAPNETPRRVGGLTDIPLVESGIQQAKALGQYLKAQNLYPDNVFTSNLLRTKQTAEYILKELELSLIPQENSMFNEINYGPDENKIEEEVVARIGQKAIIDWDTKAIVPDGWEFDPAKTIEDWKNFARNIGENEGGKTIMVVTSNGVARYAPHLLPDYDEFIKNNKLKLPTGSLGHFKYKNNTWKSVMWGVRP